MRLQTSSTSGAFGCKGGFLNGYEAILIPGVSFAGNRGLAPPPEIFVSTRAHRIGRIMLTWLHTGPNLADYPYSY